MKNIYVKVLFTDMTVGYQVIQDGNVLAYVNESGDFLFDVAPDGLGSMVLEAEPSIQNWMS